MTSLTKILTLASLQGVADILSGEGIRFDEFEMTFQNNGSLMTITEIYAIGPAISILMEGYIEKKKPIIIPRSGDLNEHINNHQLDLFKKLNALDLIYTANSRDDFYNLIKKNIFTHNNNLKPDPLINIMKDQILKSTK